MEQPKNFVVYFLFTVFLWGVPTLVSAQGKTAVLTLKNGEVHRGYAKNGKYTVKFRASAPEKWTRHPFDKVRELQRVSDENDTVVYHYLPTNKNDKPKPFVLVSRGKVTTYSNTVSLADVPVLPGTSGAGSAWMGRGGSVTHFYLKRPHEMRLTKVTGQWFPKKHLRKTTAAYFSDCPELVHKIENKAFKKDPLKTITHYYNTQCNATKHNR